MLKAMIDFVKLAVIAVPAVKWAVAVGGVLTVVAIVRLFGVDLSASLQVAAYMILLMVVMVVFARVAALPGSVLRKPALVLTWACLLIFIFSAARLMYPIVFTEPAIQAAARTFLREFGECRRLWNDPHYGKGSAFNNARIELLLGAGHVAEHIQDMYDGCNSKAEDARAKAIAAQVKFSQGLARKAN